MVLPNCLFDPSSPLVIDASVVININATGRAAQILNALPNRVVVTNMVAEELEAGRAKGRLDAEYLTMLVDRALIEPVALSPTDEEHFLDLVVGQGIATLDDGEAATIAWAASNNAIAVIDDKKAVALCREKFPRVVIASTADVLAQQQVVDELGESELAEAIYLALSVARMRVPDERLAWVVAAIGQARAANCNNLPERARLGLLSRPG